MYVVLSLPAIQNHCNWASEASPILGCSIEISRDIYIREYGSTLYVGLARAVSPTNTNFRLTFLLTQLQEALYEDLAVESIKFEVYHHFSGL